MYLAKDPIHCRNECDGYESHHESDKEDYGWLEQACEVLQLVFEFLVEIGGGRVRVVRRACPYFPPRRTCAGLPCGTERVAARGAASPSPLSIASRALKSPLRKTELAVASPVTCNASGIGTPASTIVHRIRQNRSRIAVVIRSPRIGVRRKAVSRSSRPCLVTVERIAPVPITATTPTSHIPIVCEEVGDRKQHAGGERKLCVE